MALSVDGTQLGREDISFVISYLWHLFADEHCPELRTPIPWILAHDEEKRTTVCYFDKLVAQLCREFTQLKKVSFHVFLWNQLMRCLKKAESSCSDLFCSMETPRFNKFRPEQPLEKGFFGVPIA